MNFPINHLPHSLGAERIHNFWVKWTRRNRVSLLLSCSRYYRSLSLCGILENYQKKLLPSKHPFLSATCQYKAFQALLVTLPMLEEYLPSHIIWSLLVRVTLFEATKTCVFKFGKSMAQVGSVYTLTKNRTCINNSYHFLTFKSGNQHTDSRHSVAWTVSQVFTFRTKFSSKNTR